MRSKRAILATVFLVLIGAAGYYWTTGNEDAMPTGSQGLADLHVDSADQEVRSLSGEEKMPSTPWVATRPSFAEVKLRAEQGDPLAQRELYKMYDECAVFNLNPQKNVILPLDRWARQKPQDKIGIDLVKKSFTTFCSTVEGGQPFPFETASHWLERSAKAGNLASQIEIAAQINTKIHVDDAQAFLQKISVAEDVDAIFAMSNIAHFDPGEWPDQETAALFTTAYSAYAWQIAACRAGYPCGSGTTIMNNQCLLSGYCGYASFETLLYDQAIPSAQRKNIEIMIALIQSKFQ